MKKNLGVIGTMVGIIVPCVAAVWFVFALDTKAGDAKKLAESNQKLLEQTSTLVLGNDAWLKSFLELHEVDSTQALDWATLPKGQPKDKKGEPRKNIPYLRKKGLPELGIQEMVDSDGQLRILDTLWDFRSKE